MPRKSKAAEETPVEEVAVEETPAEETPALPRFTRFEVQKVPASSDSGVGFVVFDTELGKRVDGPFRDEDAAVARARKREIRG